VQDPAVDTAPNSTAVDTAVGPDSTVAPDRQSVWALDPRTLLMVALASFVLLGLVALASTIDFGDLRVDTAADLDAPTPEPDDSSEQPEPANGQSGADDFGDFGDGGGIQDFGGFGDGFRDFGDFGDFGGSGFDFDAFNQFGDIGGRAFSDLRPGPGSIGLRDGSSLELLPIPGCPNGFSLGPDILIVPDPEACGFQPVPPGTEGLTPSGKSLLVPDVNGGIGGLRVGPDGQVDFVAPGDLSPGDIVVNREADGTFRLESPDGSLEIAPGDDGLSLREPEIGTERFVPGIGDPFGSYDTSGDGNFDAFDLVNFKPNFA